MLCSSSSFCFATENESICIDCFLFPTTVLTVDSESHCSFVISARFRFGSQFGAAKPQAFWLFTMALSFSLPWFVVIKKLQAHRAPKTSSTMQMIVFWNTNRLVYQVSKFADGVQKSTSLALVIYVVTLFFFLFSLTLQPICNVVKQTVHQCQRGGS